MTSRRASHAGTWYSACAKDLAVEFERYFSSIPLSSSNRVKAIISPHAGYRFSGATASWGFKSVDITHITRVFIIGPCHRTYIDGCAVPDASVTNYETPFGSLQLDMEVLREIKLNSEVAFRSLKLSDDEDEHSIELQLPLLHYVLGGSNSSAKIVPIFVGSLVQNEERVFGRILSKYFDDPSTLFVISSDFCHWGNRFRFTPNNFPRMPISVAPVFPPDSMNGKIESLDREGMDLIAKQDIEGFSKYLQVSGNTICGRNAILIFLETVRNSRTNCEIEFLNYSQSGILPSNVSRQDSSVSYASAVCYKL